MQTPRPSISFSTGEVVLLLGALLPLLGVLSSPASLLPGTELGDVYKHAWSFWHTPHSISTWPWTEALNAPSGGRLWDVMLLPSLVFAPIAALVGPVMASNLWVFVSLLLIGWVTRALVLELGGDRRSANVAGFLAQGAPYLYGYPLYSGVHERLGIWLFPLLVLCMLRLRSGGGRSWAVLGIAGYAFVGAGCGVYGIWAVLLLGVLTPFLRRRGEAWFGLRELLPLLVGIVLMSVLLLVAMKTASGANSLSPQPDRFGVLGIPWGMDFSGASLSGLLLPWEVRSTVPVDSGDALLELAYLGWIPLGVCLLGLRSKESRLYCGVALFFAVLAMGPRLELGETAVINPIYWGVAWVLPTFGSVPVPFQMVGVFAGLASVGVLALGVDTVTRRRWVLGGLLLGSVLERAVVLPTGLILETAPASVSSVYEQIDEGLVVEIPRDYRDRALSPTRSFLAQTVHEQGLPLSISTGVTRWDAFLPIRTGISKSWSTDLRCLAAGGFAWLVVDAQAYPSQDIAYRELGGISEVLGAPRDQDDRWAVFDLQALGIAPSDSRFFEPFQPLVGMDNGGQGPPVEARGPEPSMAIHSGREASTCPLSISGMRKSF